MKKRNIINLIKYHAEHNDSAFKTEAFDIARDFDRQGDSELASYIMALLSEAGTFTTQMIEPNTQYLTKIAPPTDPLPLPDTIADDIRGIVNAIDRTMAVNKFLFQGPPGSGKSESVKQVARLLSRDLYSVDFNFIIDSKLGQTGKNIAALFKEINRFPRPENIIVMFDEIDALVLDRTRSDDLREMGRATSSFLRELDAMNPQVALFATTNLFGDFDKALARRFDFVVDFGRYSQEDLRGIAEVLLNSNLKKLGVTDKNTRLFRKILREAHALPYPGDLNNIIKTSIAFSNPDDEHDYLKRLYHAFADDRTDDIRELKVRGFTLRDIEALLGVSKSTASRELKE